MKNFKKTLHIGKTKNSGNLFISVEFKDGKLSLSGVEGPKNNGDCRGGCGQIEMHMDAQYSNDLSYSKDWNKKKFEKLLEYWRDWHLNDMRPGCEHQKNFNTSEKIELIHYTWSDAFYSEMKKAGNGALTVEEYKKYREVSPKVHKALFSTSKPHYESPEIIELLTAGHIKENKRETKNAGWVSVNEHPKGLLSKPCDICGYKYGSAWKFEEAPADVLEWLFNLPETTITPAWI